MTIAAIIILILLCLAGVTLLFAVRFLLRGLRSRSAVNKQYFNVGRLEARRQVFANMISTVGLVFLAMIFAVGALAIPDDLFGGEPIFGSDAGNNGVESETQDEASVVTGAEPEVESETLAESGETAGTEAEEVLLDPTPAEPTAVPTPEPTPTPEFKKVYVNSPIVGLYIRDLPEGDIIDVLDDQTQLNLLEEQENVDGIEWIKVQTADGREGWVAEQFVTETAPAAQPAEAEN